MEVEKRVGKQINVYSYHGKFRNKCARHLSKYDLVITTYNLVASEYKTSGSLFKIKWERIAVEEAHIIRNCMTESAVSCSNLKGLNRWALSGTPVQNDVMDVYSLLKFLQHIPYSCLKEFKSEFITKNKSGRDNLIEVMQPLFLRRTKAELQAKGELKMPEKIQREISFECTTEERLVYSRIASESQSIYAMYLKQRSVQVGHERPYNESKANQSNAQINLTAILVLVMRLRQICNHPGLIDSVGNGRHVQLHFSHPMSNVDISFLYDI